jgi:hypothetical protein
LDSGTTEEEEEEETNFRHFVFGVTAVMAYVLSKVWGYFTDFCSVSVIINFQAKEFI